MVPSSRWNVWISRLDTAAANGESWVSCAAVKCPIDLAVRPVEQLAVGAVAISARRELTRPMRRGLEMEVAGVERQLSSPPPHLPSVVARPRGPRSISGPQ